MASKAMRAAKPLGLVALGWALACLYILGPRVAVTLAIPWLPGPAPCSAELPWTEFSGASDSRGEQQPGAQPFLGLPWPYRRTANIRGRPAQAG